MELNVVFCLLIYIFESNLRNMILFFLSVTDLQIIKNIWTILILT